MSYPGDEEFIDVYKFIQIFNKEELSLIEPK